MPSLGVEGRVDMLSTCCGCSTAANGKTPALRILNVSCVFLGIKGQWYFKNVDTSPGVTIRIKHRTDVAFVIHS